MPIIELARLCGQGYSSSQLMRHFKCGYKVLNRSLTIYGLNACGCRINKGSFKGGHIPYNIKSVGTISIRHHRRDGDLRYKKIETPAKWMPFSRWIWSQEYGKIIKGDKILHIDGNPLNDSLENLIALPGGAYMKYTKFKGQLNKERIRFYIRRYLEE